MLRRRGGDGVGFEILDGDGALMDLIFFVRGGDGFQLQTPCRPLVSTFHRTHNQDVTIHAIPEHIARRIAL